MTHILLYGLNPTIEEEHTSSGPVRRRKTSLRLDPLAQPKDEEPNPRSHQPVFLSIETRYLSLSRHAPTTYYNFKFSGYKFKSRSDKSIRTHAPFSQWGVDSL